MKAVRYNKKASAEKLIYCDIDKPVPNDNEVLIKINSVSLNAADYRSMKMGLILRWRDFVNRASAQRLKKIKVEFFVCNKKLPIANRHQREDIKNNIN
jgi:hypothetical protein